MKYLRHERGVTLGELVIAVAIITVMASVVVQGFGAFSTRQSFTQFVDEAGLAMRAQRQQTLGSVANTQHGFYISSTTIEYFAGASYPGAASSTVVAIPNSISATSSLTGGTQTVVFSRLIGEASATGTITFTDIRTGASSTLTISVGGLVQ